jgi:hypothetical protein
MSTQTSAPPVGLTVEVSDPNGQQQVLLEGVRPSATVNEVVAMAMSELRLPPNVDWNLRDDATSRLLPEQQPIGDIATQASPHVKVTMQPDAGLG